MFRVLLICLFIASCSNNPQPHFEVGNLSIEKDETIATLRGHVSNTSTVAASRVVIELEVLTEDSTLIDVARVQFLNMKPGQKRPFEKVVPSKGVHTFRISNIDSKN